MYLIFLPPLLSFIASFSECDSSCKTDETSNAKNATFSKKESDLSEINSSSSGFPKSRLYVF